MAVGAACRQCGGPMKHTTPQHHSQDKTNDPLSRGYVRPKAGPSYTDPLDYPSYPYPCMRDFPRILATRHDSNRTRHAYTTGGRAASGEISQMRMRVNLGGKT